jgi:hypothetical protein
MPALTVAGINLFVVEGSAYLETPEVQGQWERLPAGGVAVSTQRDGKRGLACVVRFDPASNYLTFLTAISAAPDQPGAAKLVPASGDLLLNQSLSVYAFLGRAQIRSKFPGSVTNVDKKILCPLTLKEA